MDSMWMYSVHAPADAKQASIDKYRKQVDENDPQRSPTYAAMVERMDDDFGEQSNPVAEFPDKVMELDALIDSFLADTDAVVPLPNPKFEPTKYRPQLEGKGKLR